MKIKIRGEEVEAYLFSTPKPDGEGGVWFELSVRLDDRINEELNAEMLKEAEREENLVYKKMPDGTWKGFDSRELAEA